MIQNSCISPRLRTLFAIIVILTSVNVLAADCLQSRTNVVADDFNCVNDPLGLQKDRIVQRTMDILGFDNLQVELYGCDHNEFLVRFIGGARYADRRYRIEYPVSSQLSRKDYSAPIVHELSHILQMEESRGLATLRSNFTSRQIELGADYVSGIVFSNSDIRDELRQFQLSLYLVGQYYGEAVDAHGCPEERVVAFRFGRFANINPEPTNIRRAHEDFQYETLPNVSCPE